MHSDHYDALPFTVCNGLKKQLLVTGGDSGSKFLRLYTSTLLLDRVLRNSSTDIEKYI